MVVSSRKCHKCNKDLSGSDKHECTPSFNSTMVGAGPPDNVERRVKSSTSRSLEEEHEDLQE